MAKKKLILNLVEEINLQETALKIEIEKLSLKQLVLLQKEH